MSGSAASPKKEAAIQIVPTAHAQDAFTFDPQLPSVSIQLKAPSDPRSVSGPRLPVWQWREDAYGSEPYKNERLAYYQGKLREQGITDMDHLKWLSAQLIQENGQ